MKSISPVLLLICALIMAIGGISCASKANAQDTGTASANAAQQESAQDNSAAPNLSGNWQVSWENAKGSQRQVTMQIKQDGSKLTGEFQSERDSAPLKGSLKGNQVSFNVKLPRRQASFTGTVDGDKMSGTTDQGTSWTATRQ